MTSDDLRQRAFRRVLAREAGAGADAPAIAAAARRLCEHYGEQLTPLIGDAGVAAICARTLHLTARSVRGFGPVPTSGHRDSPYVLLQLALAQQEPGAASAAAVSVLTTATELLVSFIGEGLTASLLHEAWPGDFEGATAQETTV